MAAKFYIVDEDGEIMETDSTIVAAEYEDEHGYTVIDTTHTYEKAEALTEDEPENEDEEEED